MPLRLASAQDLPDITEIYSAAFHDEDFMGPRMHPHRLTYPYDFRRYWEYKVREWYWDYSHQLVVTYTVQETEKGRAEVLTGVGDWVRHGTAWERYWGLWGNWDPRNIMKRLVLLRHRIASYWQPNRAADPEMHNIIANVFSFTTHLWSGTRATGWYLNFLAVKPAYQNRGYGRALVAWGVERAKQENVAASVCSGKGRETFYQKCGFDVQAGKITDGEGNPLKAKIEEDAGGLVLFRDPKAE